MVGGIHVGEAGQEDQAEPEEKSRRRNAAPALGNACPSLCGLSLCSCCRLHEVLQLPMILLERLSRKDICTARKSRHDTLPFRSTPTGVSKNQNGRASGRDRRVQDEENAGGAG